MEIITRAEAKKQGLSRYFTGKPCKHGHTAERYTSYGGCIPCAFGFAYKSREEDSEWWDGYMARWRKENPQKPREYYWKDPKKYRERRRRDHQLHAEERRAANSQYKKLNPQANAARQARRRARLKGSEGSYSAQDIERIHKQQRGRCLNCRKSLKNGYHVDHITPLSKGGSNWPNNLQLLCPPCNITKRDKCPIEWAQENGRLL